LFIIWWDENLQQKKSGDPEEVIIDLNDVCRLCMGKEDELISIFNNAEPVPLTLRIMACVALEFILILFEGFSCGICEKWFPTRSALVRHERIHTGERPFQCEVCQKSFAQKEILFRHLMTHTGQKPYNCPHCPKGFIQKEPLRVHMRTHMAKTTSDIQLHYCSVPQSFLPCFGSEQTLDHAYGLKLNSKLRHPLNRLKASLDAQGQINIKPSIQPTLYNYRALMFGVAPEAQVLEAFYWLT
ncbi:hypothetical protein NQ317_005766, partial [Molorchus minor]